MGTHTPRDPREFQEEVKDMLCANRFTRADLIKERHAIKKQEV